MFPILFGLWMFYGMRADHSSAERFANQLLKLGESTGDPDNLVAGRQCVAGTAFFMGKFQIAREYGESGCDAYEQAGSPPLGRVYGFDPGVLCHEWYSWALLGLGYPDCSRSIYTRGIRTAYRHGDPLTVATTKVHIAIYDALREDPAAALKTAHDAVAFCKENRILLRQAEAEIVEGWAMAELGDAEKGVSITRPAIELWSQLGARIWDPGWYSYLARAYARAGQMQNAREALQEAFDAAHKNGEGAYLAELHRMDGDLGLFVEGADAESCYRKAIGVSKKQEAKLWELRASAALARLWHSLGRRDEALSLLKPVYDWFTEGFDTRDLKEAKALLDALA
ncbi:MAG: hypothetical protein EXR36_04555 [Betaproteobacteria bacterium]|nr:hypothetical protein [Betaproteobacteria bacterium]